MLFDAQNDVGELFRFIYRPALRWGRWCRFFRRAIQSPCGAVTQTQTQTQTHTQTNIHTYSHFSLVRTISGKEKILYYRELLVSEKFLKTRWIPLVLLSPVILGEKIFTFENYWLMRSFCITLGFPCGFNRLRRVFGLFWAKCIIPFFFKLERSFIGSRFV